MRQGSGPAPLSERRVEVLADGLKFPEAPRWHDGELWFSDIHAHRVLALGAERRLRVVAEIDDRPSGIGFLPDGTPVVASMRRRRLLRLGPRGAEVFADLAALPGDFVNDLVTDGAGRTYLGFSRDRIAGQTPDPAVPSPKEGIVMIDSEGRSRVVADHLLGPNGSAVTADGQTLIVAETHARRITAFRIAADGSLEERRVFADLGEATADGLCLDAEGAVWAGSPRTGEFLRLREGGQVLDRVRPIAGEHAVACALGGSDRQTLYMLTARIPMSALGAMTDVSADVRSPLEGWIEAVRVDSPGAGWP